MVTNTSPRGRPQATPRAVRAPPTGWNDVAVDDEAGEQEFEFDLGTIDPQDEHDARDVRGRFDRHWLLVAVVLIGFGISWGITWSSDRSDDSSPPPTTTVRPTTTTTISPEPSPDVEITPGPTPPALVIEGPLSTGASTVALAAFPGSLAGDEHVWILTVDGRARPVPVPLQPGDWPYPLLFSGGSVAFVSEQTVHRLDAETTEIETGPSSARYLIPGAEPGDIWIVHTGTEVRGLTFVPNGGTETTHDFNADVWWVHAGVADGVLVSTLTGDDDGAVAYWTATEGLTERSSLADAGTVLATAGDLSALSRRDDPTSVDVVDVRTDVITAEIALDNVAEIVTDTDVLAACFSTDRSHLTVSTAEITVTYDLDDPTTPVHAIRGVAPYNAVTFTSPHELVMVVGGDLLTGIDVVTGRQHLIADLPEASWWIASDQSTC